MSSTAHTFDVIIIGSGLAGLSAALRLAPTHRVAVITKNILGDGSSAWAQGGIAAVLGEGDSYQSHIQDTLIAGAGLCDLKATEFTVEHAPESIAWLQSLGVQFTQENGHVHLTREGGHSERRIVHVTDATNASRTMLMSLSTLDWDQTLLDILAIPRQMLPQIRPSSDAAGYGATLPAGPLDGAVHVCGDLGDQQAALFGQTCFDAGEAKNTYGTGNFVLLNTGNEKVLSDNGLLTTVCYKIGDQPTVYALEGSIAVTGSLIQWLRDNLQMIDLSLIPI